MRRVFTRIAVTLVIALVLTGGLTIAGTVSSAGQLQLYLVNSGPLTTVFNDSVTTDGNCSPFLTPASLSTSPGAGPRRTEAPEPTSFSFTVSASEGPFTVAANPNAVILKAWFSSGDGTCPGQTGSQPLNWGVTCTGPTCGAVSLTSGINTFTIPAGTTAPTLFNEHAGPAAPVNVGVGDTITLTMFCPTWPVLVWNAANGIGKSYVQIKQ